jgi:hypothetical protein
MIQTIFPNNYAVFQDGSAPFTQLELCSHGLKSMEVNLNIFSGQQNHQISNIIEPLWSVLETRVRYGFPRPTSVKQLEDILQEELYRIPLETVNKFYVPVSRCFAAAWKAKGSSTPA